jgi:hypothetical protein
MLSVAIIYCYASRYDAKCRYAECRYAECCSAIVCGFSFYDFFSIKRFFSPGQYVIKLLLP